jgi:hypothetical protein
MADVETQAATWEWITANFDALEKRLSRRRVGDVPWMAAAFCEPSRATEVEAFFAPRIGALAGGRGTSPARWNRSASARRASRRSATARAPSRLRPRRTSRGEGRGAARLADGRGGRRRGGRRADRRIEEARTVAHDDERGGLLAPAVAARRLPRLERADEPLRER